MSREKSLAAELGIPGKVLHEAAVAAHAFLEQGHYDQSIGMSRGLVAGDERNWYFRQLLATALYRKGEFREALEVVDEGLKFAPGRKELAEIRSFAVKALAKR